MHTITQLECSRIAQDLQIRKVQVESVAHLLAEGNTAPFISRYRKERTGGLSEETIRQIQTRIGFLRQLHDRKQTILKSIEAHGRLTEPLKEAIQKADTTKRLEDLYLPFKPKKKGLAGPAREKGLEPLALAIWHSDATAASELDELLAGLVNPERQLHSADEARQGVQHILAEMIIETADVRAAARRVLWETGKLVASKNEKLGEGQGLDYKDYFAFTEPARQIPPHRILALNRGEKEGAIRVKMEWNAEQVHEMAKQMLAEHLLAVAGRMPLPPAPKPRDESVASSEPSPPSESKPRDESPAGSEPAPPSEATPRDESPVAAEPTPPAAPLVASLSPSEAPPALQGEPLCSTSAYRSPHTEFLRAVLDDALSRLLMPSLEREIRHELTDEAESHAVSVFARNLRSLLLQPPLRNRRVLAVDPGFRTGCKLAALDEHGSLLEHATIYPFGGAGKKGSRDKKGAPAAKSRDESANPAGSAAPAVPTEPANPGSTVEAAPAHESPTTFAEPAPAAAEPAGSLPPAETVAAVTAVEFSTPAPAPDAAAPAEPPSAASSATESQPANAPAPDRRAEAKAKIQDLITRHQLAVVALGNGIGCREVEELIADLIASGLSDIAYVIVSEAGASVYAVSQVGREEFPSFDGATRSAISIGRRLQDPLSELVKIDPQSIGVGLYQHDMGRRELKDSLEAVVESAVNQVGVDVNTASVPLLRYVSGLNQLVARDLVDYRKQHGPFASREQLLQVPSLGPARFTQAAGFLRVPNGTHPLDATWIHPENYGLVERLMAELGYAIDVLRDRERLQEFSDKVAAVNRQELAGKFGVTEPALTDIVQELSKPGHDPRDDLAPPVFKKALLKLEDLQPGMELKGTVLNVVDFGAFVDVGLKDSGLVHISQMANRYIKSPYDVVAVNDVVPVWVLNVDKERHRVSLSMIRPGTERRPPERKPPRPQQQGPRPPRGAPGPRRTPLPSGEPQPAAEGQQQPASRSPRGRGPGRGPQPRRDTPAGATVAADAVKGPESKPIDPPRPAPPPPRKPRREPPKPKLTQEAIEGKVPLRTFGELSALFAAKRDEGRGGKPAAPPPPTPRDESSSPPGPADSPLPESAPQPPEETVTSQPQAAG